MSIVVDGVVRCGKPKARGKGLCWIPLRGGKCFTHDLTDLAARNSKVASAFRDKNPDAFTLQRWEAGKRGFLKVGGMEWWAFQTEKARQWRIQNPSAHEKILREVLTTTLALDAHCDFEVVLQGDYRAVDAVIYANGKPVAAIEATESAAHTTFGRDEKLKAKLDWLESMDLATHVFYGGDNLQVELERLGTFLHAHNLL